MKNCTKCDNKDNCDVPNNKSKSYCNYYIEKKRTPKSIKVPMTDDQMYELLNRFANHHALAEGIEVSISTGGISMKSKSSEGGKIEYSTMLHDLIRGAEHFLFWARREDIL